MAETETLPEELEGLRSRLPASMEAWLAALASLAETLHVALTVADMSAPGASGGAGTPWAGGMVSLGARRGPSNRCPWCP